MERRDDTYRGVAWHSVVWCGVAWRREVTGSMKPCPLRQIQCMGPHTPWAQKTMTLPPLLSATCSSYHIPRHQPWDWVTRRAEMMLWKRIWNRKRWRRDALSPREKRSRLNGAKYIHNLSHLILPYFRPYKPPASNLSLNYVSHVILHLSFMSSAVTPNETIPSRTPREFLFVYLYSV